MERLIIVEHIEDAAETRIFDALTRGTCLERLADWLDQRLPDAPQRKLRLSIHPSLARSVLLEPEEAEAIAEQTGLGWVVIERRDGEVAQAIRHPTLTEAAQHFQLYVRQDGDHWGEVEHARRPGGEYAIQTAQVMAWIQAVSGRVSHLQARLALGELAIQAALSALRVGNPDAAMTALAAVAEPATPNLFALLPPPVRAELDELASFLAEVEDDDPAGYVTALEGRARRLVELVRSPLALAPPDGARASA